MSLLALRRLGVAALAAALLAGCAGASRSQPVLSAPAPPAAPVPAPPPPAPPAVAPPVVAPKTPPAAATPPPRETPPPPAPVLAPQIGAIEEGRLTEQARSRIEGAERLTVQIDQKALGKQQRETYGTIQSFLAKAREAMAVKDYQRAINLADKAQVLADDLSRTVR